MINRMIKDAAHQRAYKAMIEVLRETRESLGMTQKEVRLQLGRYRVYVTKIETGDRRIDPVELYRFLKIYQMDTEEFVYRVLCKLDGVETKPWKPKKKPGSK